MTPSRRLVRRLGVCLFHEALRLLNRRLALSGSKLRMTDSTGEAVR
jgi:hypothetical protein